MHNKVQHDNQLLLLLQMDQKNCFYTLIRFHHFTSIVFIVCPIFSRIWLRLNWCEYHFDEIKLSPSSCNERHH